MEPKDTPSKVEEQGQSNLIDSKNQDELLNLGNEIYKNNLKFDNTGNYQFFRNLLNLKDNKDLCTYEQFVNYLN